jgi:hypothetical protein
MMNRSTLISLAFAAISLFFLFSSNSNGRATQTNNGNTGAPGETATCANCHSGGAYGNVTVTIEMFLDGTNTAVSSYNPGQTYDMRVTVQSSTGSPLGYSFQMTCLTSPANTPLGGYSALASNVKQKLVTAGTYMGRTYVEHNGVGTNNQFNMSWTAPAAGTGAVKFYAAGNCVNLNGSTGGDKVGNSSITINENAPVQITAAVVDPLCAGANTGSINLTLLGGTSPFTYEWNDGNTDQDRTNLGAGEYTVVITDGNGDTFEEAYVLLEPAPIQISTEITNPQCYGFATGEIAASISGGESPYSVQIENSIGEFQSNLNNLAAGFYILHVTDNNDCEATVNFEIVSPSEIVPNVVTSNITCFGVNDGTFIATPTGGTGAITAVWSDEYVGLERTNIEPSSYIVMFTDEAGCLVEDIYEITEPAELIGTLDVDDMLLCVGATAQVEIGSLGGTGTVTGTGSFEYPAGDYSITLVDENLCSVNVDFIIEESPAFSVEGSANAIPCVGGSTDIVFTATGGVQPYFTLLDPITINIPGTYNYTFLDGNGCESAIEVIVESTDGFTISSNVLNSNCFNSCDGSIALTIEGAQGNATASWNNGSEGLTIGNLCAGTFEATVTDEAGCTIIDNFTITAPTDVISIIEFDPILCNGATTTLTVTTTGGTEPYTYTWSGQNVTTTILADAGEYTLVTTDNNNCSTGSISYTIDEPTALSYVVDLFVPGGFGTGIVEITTNGGTAPYTWAWSNGDETEDTFLPENSTSTCTITDANGCSLTTEEFITLDSVDEIANASLSVYPNPANNTLNFQLNRTNIRYTNWTLINNLGAVVLTDRVNTGVNTIDVSKLSEGVYTIKLSNQENVIAKKVIIE